MGTVRIRECGRRFLIVLVVVGLTVAALGGPVAAADDWDPRIADIAHDVERLRGLEFDHPVPIDVLGDKAFEHRLLAGGAPTRRDRKEWDETQAAFLAMGLLDKRVGYDAVRRASGTNVAGFYDPDLRAIVVRGSRIKDPQTRVVLAHELTHALQDQHFGIAALEQRAAKADSLFTKALIEGDATNVERQYYATLTADDQEAASAADDEALAEATPLPPFLQAVSIAPYLFGADAVAVLWALGGQRRLDATMTTPPTRDLGLVDPTALVGPHEWVRVPAPPLGRLEVELGDPFPMDAVGLYLVLAEHLPWTDALVAAERWGGDRAVAFTRAGQPCVRMRYAGRHGVEDAVAIGDAFRRWEAAGGTATEVKQDREQTTITLCDTLGRAAGPAPTPPAQAMIGLSIRNSLVAEGLGDGASLRSAKCTADRLARLPEVATLVASVQSLQEEVSEESGENLRRAIRANHHASQRACAAAA